MNDVENCYYFRFRGIKVNSLSVEKIYSLNDQGA
jgi:hypothetical protein